MPDVPSVVTPWLVGGTALLAFLASLGRWVVAPAIRFVRRVDHTMRTVEAELCVNGDEGEIAHPDDHGKPLRTLVLGTRGELREINQRLVEGEAHFAGQDRRLDALEGGD